MSVPELVTARVRLRNWQSKDVEPMAAINVDPRVGDWLSGTIGVEETRTRLQLYASHWEERAFGIWAVEERGSRRLVGRTGLMRWDDWTASPHDAEIGWTFDPGVWGRGYATEAARAALAWAATQPGLRTIISNTRPDNVASRRVMEKLGLSYRGEALWRGFRQVWYGTGLTEHPVQPIRRDMTDIRDLVIRDRFGVRHRGRGRRVAPSRRGRAEVNRIPIGPKIGLGRVDAKVRQHRRDLLPMLSRVVGGLEQHDPFGKVVALAVPRALQHAISGGIPRDLDQALTGEAQVLGDVVDAGEGIVILEAVFRAWLPICQRSEVPALRAG